MDNYGKVIAVSDTHLYVDVPDTRKAACGTCEMAASCGQNIPSASVKRYRFKKPSGIQFSKGDFVLLRHTKDAFKTGLLYVYIFPTICALAGCCLAGFFTRSHPYADLYMTLGALAGVVIGYFIAAQKNKSFQLQILPLNGIVPETAQQGQPDCFSSVAQNDMHESAIQFMPKK